MNQDNNISRDKKIDDEQELQEAYENTVDFFSYYNEEKDINFDSGIWSYGDDQLLNFKFDPVALKKFNCLLKTTDG